MIHNEGNVFALEVKFVWDGVSLGIALVIYAIAFTVTGVLLPATPAFPPQAGGGGGSLDVRSSPSEGSAC